MKSLIAVAFAILAAGPLPMPVAETAIVDLAQTVSPSVTPSTQFTSALRVRATGSDDLAVVVTAQITDEAFTEIAQIDAFLASEEDPSTHAAAVLATDPVSIDAGATTTIPVAIAGTAMGLDAEEAGPHGVLLTVETEDGTPLDTVRTVTTWTGGALGPLALTSLVDAPSSLEGDGTTDGLGAVTSTTVVLDGVATPASVGDTLIEAGYDAMLAGPAVDATSLAHAGDTNFGGLAYTTTYLTSPSSWTLNGILVEAPVADASTLSWMSGATSSQIVADIGTGDSLVAVENAGTVVIDPDEEAVEALAAIAPGADAGARAAAILGLRAAQGASAVVLPYGDGIDSGVEGLMAALGQVGWIVPSTLAEVMALEPTTTVTLDDVLDAENDMPAGTIDELASRLPRLSALAIAATDPAAAGAEWTAPLLLPLASELRGNPALIDAAVETALTAADATADGLTIAEGSDLTLIASSGNVPVSISSTLDHDVTVTVMLASTSPRLVVENAPEVTIPANSTAQAIVPVEAISNGRVPVSITLTNLEGTVVATPVSGVIDIHAEWGNAATGLLAALLVALLAFGIFRTVRRGPRSTRTGHEATGAKAGADEKAAETDD